MHVHEEVGELGEHEGFGEDVVVSIRAAPGAVAAVGGDAWQTVL